MQRLSYEEQLTARYLTMSILAAVAFSTIHAGQMPDIWTVTPQKQIIGNWTKAKKDE